MISITRMSRSSTLGLLAAAAAFLSTDAHAAITWSYLAGGDAAFNALTVNGTLERTVTEGRIGNNAVTGTWETAIWQQGGVGTPQAQGQLAWGNGQPTAFSIVYDGAGSISYTVGATTISWNGIEGPFTDIFIRTRSAADSSVLLDSLDFDGTGIGDLSSSGNGDVNYIRIRNGGANFGAFTITGLSTFDWGALPSNSALAYQFKFTNVIPGPGALALLGLAGLVGRRRRG